MFARRYQIIFLGLIGAASPARADVPPATPGVKFATAVHRVESREAHPDHVFVVVRHGSFDPVTHAFQDRREAAFADLAPGRPITLTPGYRQDVDLLIVTRAAAAAHPPAADLAAAVLAGRVPGAVRKTFYFRETVPDWAGGEVVVTYQVVRAGAGDGLEIVRTSWSPLVQCWAAGICVPVALVLGGFWRVRRLRRRPNA